MATIELKFTSLFPSSIPFPISSFGSLNSPKRVSNSPQISKKERLNPSNLHHFHTPFCFLTSRFNFGVPFNGTRGYEKWAGGLVRVWCRGAKGEEDYDRDDGFFMRKAVELAREAIGCTSPNPMVGCVIVKDGHIVGQGFHPKAGQPHAEVFAIRDAGDLTEDATAYVSLEPCNHYGRTPPCTEALIKAKVKKVVVGMVDPNPIVASKGVDRLRDAGIEVVVGVEEELCKKLNEAYIHKMLTGMPFVTLRYTISINGRILDQLGEGVAESGGYYSKLLQEYDVFIHSATALAKESSFPASKEHKANQPLHVLLAKSPASPIWIPSLATESALKAIIFTDVHSTAESDAAKMGIERVVTDGISLEAILEYCKNQGSCSVLLDLRGTSHDLEEILKAGIDDQFLQKVLVEVLPLWAGGSGKMPSTLMNLTQRIDLKKLSSKMIGESVLLEGYF